MSLPKISILVVDDEETTRKVLKRTLGNGSFDLHFASTAAEALDVVLRSHPVDIVISDHSMPGMSGVDFLKIVCNRWPNTVRILLTGHADLKTAMDAINYGDVYRIITKPWAEGELDAILYFATENILVRREKQALLTALQRQHERALEKEARWPSAANPGGSAKLGTGVLQDYAENPDSVAQWRCGGLSVESIALKPAPIGKDGESEIPKALRGLPE